MTTRKTHGARLTSVIEKGFVVIQTYCGQSAKVIEGETTGAPMAAKGEHPTCKVCASWLNPHTLSF